MESTITSLFGYGNREGRLSNIGKMKNRGVDIDVAYNKRFLGNRLGFQAKANVSVLKNEITDLGDQTRIFHDNEVQVIASQVGMPYGSFYGYDCTGVYQLSDFNWTDQAVRMQMILIFQLRTVNIH